MSARLGSGFCSSSQMRKLLGSKIPKTQDRHQGNQHEGRDDPGELRVRRRRHAQPRRKKPTGGTGCKRHRRKVQQRPRNEVADDGRALRDVESTQHRPQDKAHEDIGARPQYAREDVNPIQEPEVMTHERDDQDGRKDEHPPRQLTLQRFRLCS